MRRNRLLGLFLLVTALTLQSCFEIREIVKINSQGAGTFSLVIDMSELKSMLEGFAESEEIAAESPFSEMETEFASLNEKLEDEAGISNPQLISGEDGYRITSSFNFSSTEALNRGMALIYENEEANEEPPEYYQFRRKKFERSSTQHFIQQIKNEFVSEENDMEGVDLYELFSDVAYVNQVIFEDMQVRKVKKGSVDISEDLTTVTNRYLIFNEEEEQSLGYVIRVK